MNGVLELKEGLQEMKCPVPMTFCANPRTSAASNIVDLQTQKINVMGRPWETRFLDPNLTSKNPWWRDCTALNKETHVVCQDAQNDRQENRCLRVRTNSPWVLLMFELGRQDGAIESCRRPKFSWE